MIDFRIPLGKATSTIDFLIRTYGEKSVKEAVKEALEKNIATPSYLSQHCQKKNIHNEISAPLDLSSNPKINNIFVSKHKLSKYDSL